MLDKMMRVESMVPKLSMDLRVKEDMLLIIKEAASLAMSDLATAVVTEFTSLSGIMARHYALRDGYSQQVVSSHCQLFAFLLISSYATAQLLCALFLLWIYQASVFFCVCV